MHVMFLCLGNICRSPMAERVAQRLADERGMNCRFSSAGISDEEHGNPIDSRARRLLAEHGYTANGHRARQLDAEMAEGVDLFVVAEARHARRLTQMQIPTGRVRLITDFDPESEPGAPLPDPWYGNQQDFEHTLEVLERAIPVLLDELAAGTLASC